MQVVLVMLRGDGERRSFSIVRDVTVIGRREDCDFRIPLGDISRKHCRLVKEDGVLKIQDLGSSNGTFVNNHRIQEAELSPGDSLHLGGVSFVVQIDGVPDDADIDHTQPNAEHAAPAAASESTTSEPTPSESASGEFDPLSALGDPLGDSNSESNLGGLSESQIRRDLMSELGDSAAREQS